MSENNIIFVRGGGDIATGTISRLHLCGFRVLVLETPKPTAIRRAVSFCEAVYDGEITVECVTAKHIDTVKECEKVWSGGNVAVLVDPEMNALHSLHPLCVVDAIIAKKNTGTTITMAPVTIGMGPGFHAGRDVHAVIETARGHNLGRIIYSGPAQPDSGIPGEISGYTRERVIYAETEGELRILADIGSRVLKGQPVATVDTTSVKASISGVVRGMIRDGAQVHNGMKIIDIDPRLDEQGNCNTISDKARCISGGVLEALLVLSSRL